MMRKIGKCRFSEVFPQSRNLNFSGRNAISFFKSVDKMACVGISYHPYHVFYLVLSALQQAVGHLHSFFHDVFINRAIKTDFEPLFQFGFAQKTLFGNLCDWQRTVSYTHLDVYKRQDFMLWKRPCGNCGMNR